MQNLNEIIGEIITKPEGIHKKPVSMNGNSENCTTNATNDYIGADGLLYCGSCHTPKQMRIEERFKGFFPDTDFMPVLCKCTAERVEREEREEKRRQAEIERYVRYSENLSRCFSNTARREQTFENDRGQNPKLTNAARDFVERFERYREMHTGIMFSGNVGAGKTYAAACIANDLLKRGYRVIFRTENELLREACGNKCDFLRAYLENADLFILDDFGACIKSEKQASVIFPYIDDWCTSKKPLIITTNLRPASLKDTGDTEKARIYSRVIEVCSIPVITDGEDARRVISREKFGRLR